jgi:hypothetical protein
VLLRGGDLHGIKAIEGKEVLTLKGDILPGPFKQVDVGVLVGEGGGGIARVKAPGRTVLPGGIPAAANFFFFFLVGEGKMKQGSREHFSFSFYFSFSFSFSFSLLFFFGEQWENVKKRRREKHEEKKKRKKEKEKKREHDSLTAHAG